MRLHSLYKNSRALSPVIATIILVAVTVAIAIAVAAWLGALTFTYTRTEQIQITQTTISTATSGATAGQVIFSLANSGTSDVSVNIATVQGGSFSGSVSGTLGTASTTPCTVTSGVAIVAKGASCNLLVTFPSPYFASGIRYDFNLVTTQGNKFPTSGIA